MEASTAQKKPRSVLKKIGLFFLGVIAILVVMAAVAHFSWKYSGSDKWEFMQEIDGVKVYSKKTSGEVFTKFKLEGIFHSSLAGIVKLMRDPAACDDVGCTNSYIIETKDFPNYVTYTFRYPMPSPFKPREFVVISQFKQDPKTKEIYVDYKSVPDKLTPNDCCVRVLHMNNSWRFKPLKDNEVAVEYIYDNPADGIPYFLVNGELGKSLHQNIPELQKVLDMDKYKNAKLDYVLESDVESVATQETSAL